MNGLNPYVLAAVRAEEEGRCNLTCAVWADTQSHFLIGGGIAAGHDFFEGFGLRPGFDFFGTEYRNRMGFEQLLHELVDFVQGAVIHFFIAIGLLEKFLAAHLFKYCFRAS